LVIRFKNKTHGLCRGQDKNEDTSVIDEVFQASELVEPYRVVPLIDLEENSNFHVFNDSFKRYVFFFLYLCIFLF
jgi:hypothetical protein